MTAWYQTRPLGWRIECDRVELRDEVRVRNHEGEVIGEGLVIESHPFEWGAHTVLVTVATYSPDPIWDAVEGCLVDPPVQVHFSRKGWSPRELSDGELSKLIEVVSAAYAIPGYVEMNTSAKCDCIPDGHGVHAPDCPVRAECKREPFVESVSERCRRIHDQQCFVCDDLECCDNATEEATRRLREKLEKR